MHARTRSIDVELVANLYPGGEANLARWCDGLHDPIGGGVYVPTHRGVVRSEIGSWIAKTDHGFEVLTEAEVFDRFEPLDVNEAYRVLGGRSWPSASTSVEVALREMTAAAR